MAPATTSVLQFSSILVSGEAAISVLHLVTLKRDRGGSERHWLTWWCWLRAFLRHCCQLRRGARLFSLHQVLKVHNTEGKSSITSSEGSITWASVLGEDAAVQSEGQALWPGLW